MISGDSYSDIELSSSSGGISIFAIDPGETTGWAWVCLGRREIDGFANGDRKVIETVRSSRSGYLKGDKRMEYGEIESVSDRKMGRVIAETRAAENVLIEVVRCRNQAGRVSKGRLTNDLGSIIIEDFILRQRTKNRNLLAPVRLASLIEAMVYGNGLLFCPIILQTSSDALGTLTDQRMKNMGLWIPGYPHATDAFRHLLLCLRRVNAL